jgi:hypothetical protein
MKGSCYLHILCYYSLVLCVAAPEQPTDLVA